MNRIFRVVFNEATGLMTAASELAGSGRKAAIRTVVVVAAGAAMTAGGPTQADTLVVPEEEEFPVTQESVYESATARNGSIVVNDKARLSVTGEVNLVNKSVVYYSSGSVVALALDGGSVTLGSETTPTTIRADADRESERSAYSVLATTLLKNDGWSMAKIQGKNITLEAYGTNATNVRSIGSGSLVILTAADTLTLKALADPYDATAINSQYSGKASLNAKKLQIDATANGEYGVAYGVDINGNGKVSLSATDTLSIDVKGNNGAGAMAIRNKEGMVSLMAPAITLKAQSDSGTAYAIDNSGMVTIYGNASITGGGTGILNTGLLNLASGTTTVTGSITGSGTVNVGSRAEDGTTTAATLAAFTTDFGRMMVNAGSTWKVTGDSDVKALNATGASIDAGTSRVTIDELTVNDSTTLNSSSAQEGQIRVATLTNNGSLTVSIDSKGADAVSGSTAAEKLASAAKILSVDKSENDKGLKVKVAEGRILGAISGEMDSEGKLVAGSVTEKSNTAMTTLKNVASNNAQVFRGQMNDLDKRMGDLRTMPQSDGAWARVIAGQSEYKNSHNTYQTLQVGADKRFGNFFAGVMGSYTDGDGTLSNGSTDDKNYSFGIYGGWLGEDGQFVDVTIKRHKYESDYDIYYTSGEKIDGSMDTSGTSVSLEYGRRFGITNTNYYVEPQVEFMYGHLNSTGYTTSNGVRISQDAVKTATGRLGVAAGWVDPAKRGSAYIKASVLNDWAGNIRTSATAGDVSRRYHEDTGGTWGEFAVGGTVNITKNVSAYGEMETTAGNPVRTTYQVTGGVRVAF